MNSETSQICVPASKVCDGYLDMLLSVNGTIIKVCPKRGGDSMLAVQGERMMGFAFIFSHSFDDAFSR